MSDSQFEFEPNYDDDFDDDDEDIISTGGDNKKRSADGKKNLNETLTLHDSISTYSKGKRAMATSKNSNGQFKAYMTPVPGRTRSDTGGKRGKKPKKQLQQQQQTNNSANQTTVIKRVLSASRRKSAALHNAIHELQQQCTALTLENRDLKRNARQQDRDLKKLDSAEAQLPAILKKHANEMEMLSEKYRRQKEMSSGLSDNLKRTDAELLRAKDRVKELQGMVKEKNLGERIELRNKIEDLEKLIEERDNKLSELNRNTLLQKKLHSRVLKDKNEKHDKDLEKIKLLEEVQQNLLSRIKDLEKALEVTNIYSRRKQKEGKEMPLFSTQGPLAPILKKFQQESLQLIEKIEASNSIVKPPPTKRESSGEKEKRGAALDNSSFEYDIGSTDDHDAFYEISNSKEQPPVDAREISPLKTEKAVSITEEVSPLKLDRAVIVKDKSPNEKNVNGNDELLHRKLDEMSKQTEKLKIDDTSVKTLKSKNQSPDLPRFQPIATEVQSQLLEKEVSRRQMGTSEGTTKPVKVEKVKLVENVMETKAKNLKAQTQTQIGLEDDQGAKNRQLLLAKLQAIDSGENPNSITETSMKSSETKTPQKPKANKKPIFLESSPKVAQNSDSVSASSKPLNLFTNSDPTPNSTTKPRALGGITNGKTEEKPAEWLFADPTNENSPSKERERKDSWEFKRTDENLHKGLHAHANMPGARNPGSQSNSADKTRKHSNTTSNGDSNYLPTAVDKDKVLANNGSDGEAGSPLTKPKGTRNRTSVKNTEDNMNGGYLPTMFDSASNKKTNKKKGDDLFNQFEDPFKSKESTPNVKNNSNGSPGTLLGREKEGSREFFPRSKKNSITSDHTVDDLEEMFIL